MSARPLFGKRDAWVFLGILALALICVYARPGRDADGPGGAAGVPGPRARISVDGAVVKTVDLSQDGEFSLDSAPNIRFSVRNGAIAFLASDCRDKTCVHSGYLSRPGQVTACLPNRVTLAVAGTDKSDPGAADAVAH